MNAVVVRLVESLRRTLLHERFGAWVLMLAVAVRLLWILAIPAEPTTDFGWYYRLGLRIAEGQGYTMTDDGFPLWEPGKPLILPRATAFWPIGYPGFLGVLFLGTGRIAPLFVAKLANVALYVGVLLAASYLARRVFRSVLAGRIALVMLAFAPNQIAYSSLLSVEIWFSFLALGGVALTVLARDRQKRSLLVLAGLCFGLATLTKPQAVFLPGLVLLVLDWKKPARLLERGALVYTALTLCVAPWSWRNSLAFEQFVFVSNNGGINLLIGNMPGSWGESGLMWNRELHTIIATQNDELARDVAARRVAVDHIRGHLIQVLSTLPGKFFWLHAVDVDGFGWNRSAAPGLAGSSIWTPLRVIAQAHYLAMAGLALAGAVKFRRRRLELYWIGPAVCAYFTAVYLVFFGGARFHFPLIPWLSIFASGLLASWLEPKPRSLDQDHVAGAKREGRGALFVGDNRIVSETDAHE